MIPSSSRGARLWEPVFAHGYDVVLGLAERGGLAERRRELLGAARGDTIEIGAGTGANAKLYPPGVGRLVLTEPDPRMARRLRRKSGTADVVVAPGERIPFPENSFDTVVFTMVLCTAPSPRDVLTDVARVLRPDGVVLFFEHVRSSSPRLARWQDRLSIPWCWFGNGCRCNQLVEPIFDSSPLQIESLQHAEIPRIMPLVKPLVVGTASRRDRHDDAMTKPVPSS